MRRRNVSSKMEIQFPGGSKVDAHYDGFVIKTDQPENSGGNGSAAAPYDLFLASIGTCAGIYVVRFCQARKMETEGLRIVQTWDRDPETGRITNINLEIITPAGFPEKYNKALVSSANLCAVKKTMANPPDFDIRVKNG
jgi:putative redox protein